MAFTEIDATNCAKIAETNETALGKDYSTHPLQKLADVDVKEAVSNLQRQVKLLETENLIFTTFLNKIDPTVTAGMEDHVKQAEDRASIRRSTMLTPRSFKRFSDVSSLDPFLNVMLTEKTEEKVNITQKSDLIQRQIENSQEVFTKYFKKHHKIKNKLVVQMEEILVRKTELEETLAGFEEKRDRDGLTLAKLVGFMQKHVKKMRLIADKLRLRYSSLKVQYQKLTAILAQKQLIGENVQEIDFEQLRIENLQLVEKIDTFAILLLELKRIAGAGNLLLSKQKAILFEKMQKQKQLRAEIEDLGKTVIRSDDELLKLQQEVAEVQNQHDIILDYVSNHKAPELMDYIRAKKTINDLKKEIKIWHRKKNVKELAFSAFMAEAKRNKKMSMNPISV